MKHLEQDKPFNCSQTCLAMITGQHVRYIEHRIVGHDKGTDIEAIIDHCKTLKISIGKKWRKWFFSFLIPLNCFVVVGFESCNEKHLIVRKKGIFFDPNGTIYLFMPKRYKRGHYLTINFPDS